VKAIDRKLWRELSHLRGQLLAIVLVLACGIAAFVTMLSNLQALERSLERYYTHHRFADLFAQVVRAPERLGARIAEIPGVAQVETRVVEDVSVNVPEFGEPIRGRLISLPSVPEQGLNQLFVRRGRLPERARSHEVAVLEGFAVAHDLIPGDRISALINGRYQELEIVGLVLSPEYVYALPPGSAFPDPSRYALMWTPRPALAAAFDMDSAFNDVVLALTPGADADLVRQRLDLLLAPYGGIDSYERELQFSHRLISMEIEQLRGSGLVVPLIFLGVAAFLLNVVLTRLISTQREQIAALKALGYSNREVGLHYTKLVALVLAAGTALGIAVGGWLGRGLADLYLTFFAFPAIHFRLEPSLILASAGVAALAGGVGTFNAVRQVIKLPPAEAMRPAAPSAHGRSLVDRLGLLRVLSPAHRMVVRNLVQKPVRALMTAAGIAMAVAILVTGSFTKDSLDYLVRVQFGLAQRYDLEVAFNKPLDRAAVRELEQLPGVLLAEPFRTVPARLVAGHRRYQTALQGLPPASELRRVLDEQLRVQPVPSEGVILSSNLAERLRVRVGDTVEVEILEGERVTRPVVVAAIVDEMLGVSAYMDNAAINRLMREGPRVSGAWLLVDPELIDPLYAELRETPAVAAVSRLTSTLEAFEDTSKEIQMTSRTILLVFASIIAIGVVYNSARITLSERSRELASLRVIGFSKAEVSSILLGEFAILLATAIPFGWLFGWYLAWAALASVDSDLYRFPLIIEPATYAFAALVVVIAGVATALLVRRRVNHLDLVAVLKTRE